MSLKVVTRKASPHLYLRGTVRGEPIYESTGTDEPEAAEAIRIQREGQVLQRSVYGERATASFAEAAVAYLKDGGEARFLGSYKAGQWSGLIGHFWTRPLAKIGQAEIDPAAAKLYPSASPATLNRQVYTPMSAVLNYAATKDLTEPRRLRRPRQPKGRTRWLRPDEAERLIVAAAPHLQPIVIFMLYTGARVSEALYLDWREVDLGRRRVRLIETKNGRARGVSLHERIVVALANLPGPKAEGPVFLTDKGVPYRRKVSAGGQIRRAFSAACRRAGIADFTPHGIRHTFATWFLAETGNLKGLMEICDWSSLASVRRYMHVNPDHLAAQIDRLPAGPAVQNPCSALARAGKA